MAEDEKNWLEDFVGIMSGASDVVRNVVETINAVAANNLPSPLGVPTARQQAQEREDVQGEQRSPEPAGFDVPDWLPVLAVVVVLILVVKA